MAASEPSALLRIYTEERAKGDGGPLYRTLVLKAREQGLAGATVLRGPMGFGASGEMHNAGILDLSDNLPLVIEIVDAEEKLRRFAATLGDLKEIALITLGRIEILRAGKTAQ